MKIFMCGDTGRLNRGCEAIVRGSAEVLNGENIYLATFATEQNRPMAREIGLTMIPYQGYPTKIHRYFCAGMRKIFPKSLIGYALVQKNLLKRINTNDVCLNIGGDTYCYTRPTISLALNKYTNRKRIKTVLWCCSIEKDKIKGEILQDLNRYQYIFAREQITVDNLRSCGVAEDKIVKVCDPAFFLKTKKVDLPEGFQVGNTVGINLSDCVVYGKYHSAYENTKVLIDWILKETDMSVCLVPHVYAVNDLQFHDYPILKRLYEEFDDKRVSLIDKEYDCEQLKYIISNCRFFLGARTHSTIAAYSSHIPTLVIGYSVKSKGIATDLFGTYENYVIPFETITEDDQILKSFKLLMEKEEEIKTTYDRVLPAYRKQLTDAVEKYILDKSDKKKFEICDRFQCTGCSACAASCPNNCIEMGKNKEGFLYPIIDYSRCIQCGKCRRVCPVANKNKDDNAIPVAYAAVNKDKSVRAVSSSGGIFTLLAKQVIENGGCVVGASFDEKNCLKHRIVQSIEDLKCLVGSKYVQSEIGSIYGDVEKILKEGRTVYFSGTPCQIAGIYAYLGKKYDNLITQDLVCHGVPSPSSWEKYLAYRLKKANAKQIVCMNMRKKTEDGSSSLELNFDNGKVYCEEYKNDAFVLSYLSNINLRSSCVECHFKQLHRQADITLGDFWGVESVAAEMDDKNGISLVLIHSEKGANIFSEIQQFAECKCVDFDKAIAENKAYLVSSPSNPLRNTFLKKVSKDNFDKVTQKYSGRGISAKIRRFFSKF